MAENIMTTNRSDSEFSPAAIFDDTEQRSRVQKYFDQDNNWLGEIYETSSDTHARGVRRRIKYIFEMLDSLNCYHGGTAIDIGCGPGAYVNKLLDRGCGAIGTDLSLQMLNVCKKRFQNSKEKSTDFLCSDVLSLPFRDQSFDIVICVGVIQYVISVTDAINELFRITDKQGVVVVCFENVKSLSNYGYLVRSKIRLLINRTTSGFSAGEPSGIGTFSKWFLNNVRVPHLYKLYNPPEIEKIMAETGFKKISSRTYGYSLRLIRRMKIFPEKFLSECEIVLENFFYRHRIPYLSNSGEFYIGLFNKP